MVGKASNNLFFVPINDNRTPSPKYQFVYGHTQNYTFLWPLEVAGYEWLNIIIIGI